MQDQADSKETLATSVDPPVSEGENSPIVPVLLRKRRVLVESLAHVQTRMLDTERQFTKQMDQMRSERSSFEEALEHIDALLRLEGHEAAPEEKLLPVSNGEPGRDSAVLMDAVHELLGKNKHPMHYREIAGVLSQQHIHISGQDPAATLLTKMTRDQRFKRTAKRGTYGLADWTVRTANKRRRARRRRKAKR